MDASLPIMVFDGDCCFCRRWVARWRRATWTRVRYIAYQHLGSRLPEISREAASRAVQFRDRDGRIYSGADAVVRLFDYGLPGGRLAGAICANPPVIWILRIGYKLVARNRSFFSWLTRAFERMRRRFACRKAD